MNSPSDSQRHRNVKTSRGQYHAESIWQNVLWLYISNHCSDSVLEVHVTAVFSDSAAKWQSQSADLSLQCLFIVISTEAPFGQYVFHQACWVEQTDNTAVCLTTHTHTHSSLNDNHAALSLSTLTVSICLSAVWSVPIFLPSADNVRKGLLKSLQSSKFNACKILTF